MRSPLLLCIYYFCLCPHSIFPDSPFCLFLCLWQTCIIRLSRIWTSLLPCPINSLTLHIDKLSSIKHYTLSVQLCLALATFLVFCTVCVVSLDLLCKGINPYRCQCVVEDTQQALSPQARSVITAHLHVPKFTNTRITSSFIQISFIWLHLLKKTKQKNKQDSK